MGHKLRNTLYITSTENPIVHRARTCPLVMGLDGLRWAAKRGLVKVRTPDLFSRTWISSEKLKISMVCFLCESVFWRCVSVIHDEKNGAPKRER